MVQVPERLARYARAGRPGGAEWIERLPGLVEACLSDWHLTFGAALPSTFSFVARVTREDATPAMLKVALPEPGAASEGDALVLWNGDGAVLAYETNSARCAFLLEWLEPATPLWDLADDDEGLRIAARLLRRLWRRLPPGHPFSAATEVLSQYAQELESAHERVGAPCERSLLEAALQTLTGPMGVDTLVHGDLHGGNVCRSARAPWLAIDPAPLAAEPEYDAGWLLTDRKETVTAAPDPAAILHRRLGVLSQELELDPDRIRRWAIARNVLNGVFCYEIGADESGAQMLECARRLA